MSFSADIKNEISMLSSSRTEDIAELSAIVRDSDSSSNINIVTENNAVARRVYRLFRDIYDKSLKITVRRRSGFNNNLVYILNYNGECSGILRDLSIIDSSGNRLNKPSEYLVSDGESMRAYLKGLFEVCGSINDPKTSGYHLEFVIHDLDYAKEISNYLNLYNLNSKVIVREKNYMVYIKEAEKISDFLRMIKAYNGVMYFEDIRIYRDYKNMSNRLNNCELANMDKVFMTSSKQIKDIEKLKEYDMLDIIDNKLREAVDYRIKYPESSLQELSDIMSKELGYNISKSGLNHRFRKIREIVNRIENK